MAELKSQLIDGLKIGEAVYKTVTLKEATAGDQMDAEQAAEMVYMAPTGPFVEASPSRLAVELLARQVSKLTGEAGAEFDGAVTVTMLRSLSRGDLALLLTDREKLDSVAEREVLASRGRD